MALNLKLIIPYVVLKVKIFPFPFYDTIKIKFSARVYLTKDV